MYGFYGCIPCLFLLKTLLNYTQIPYLGLEVELQWGLKVLTGGSVDSLQLLY